jgi:hypothetical protein
MKCSDGAIEEKKEEIVSIKYSISQYRVLLLTFGFVSRCHDDNQIDLIKTNCDKFFFLSSFRRVSTIFRFLKRFETMDDTTDKYCSYKRTDCMVANTKDLYKSLNLPKRFSCPCESQIVFCFPSDLFSIYLPRTRCILRLWNPTRATALNL